MKGRLPGSGRLLAAIAGGPGSGKSTLLGMLEETAKETQPENFFAFLPFDGFHFPNSYLDTHEHNGAPLRKIKGAPPSFDTAKAAAKLKELRKGNSEVGMPVYSRELHDPVEDAIRVPPETRVVVMEGNYLLHDGPGYAEMLELFDVKIYLDADFETAKQGVIARHIRGGRTPEDAEQYFERVDSKNYELVKKTSGRADIVVKRSPDNILSISKK